MTLPIISVENLGKRYRLRHQAKAPYETFREAAARQFLSMFKPRRRGQVDKPTEEDFWALKDINFKIEPGDVVGIIGRNGAGKSTLLKILSRITEPTTGRISLHGRIASLLEVGTGFHPELTGRENIFLNGSILGMTNREVRRQFDEIVTFAEVERFLDTPVKHYSSGMYMRLAFAIAAHLEPEVLVVDEVLAVGDSQFQAKCLARMRTVAGRGRTVLFVSHNMTAVSSLCNRGIFLDRGSIGADGTVEDAVTAYRNAGTAALVSLQRKNERKSPLFISHVSAALEDSPDGHVLTLEAVLVDSGERKAAFVAYDIMSSSGFCLMQALPTQECFLKPICGTHRLCTDIRLPPLIPGTYSVTMWVGSHYSQTIDVAEECADFQVFKSPTVGRTHPHTIDHGYIVPGSVVRVHTMTASKGIEGAAGTSEESSAMGQRLDA